MTVFKKLHLIYDEYRYELSENERDFIDNMVEGVAGTGDDMLDEDLGDYLTFPQMNYIEDIAERLSV